MEKEVLPQKRGFGTVESERYWMVKTQVSTKAIRTKGSITFQRSKAEKYYPSTVCTYDVKSNRSFILLSLSFGKKKKKTSEYINYYIFPLSCFLMTWSSFTLYFVYFIYCCYERGTDSFWGF